MKKAITAALAVCLIFAFPIASNILNTKATAPSVAAAEEKNSKAKFTGIKKKNGRRYVFKRGKLQKNKLVKLKGKAYLTKKNGAAYTSVQTVYKGKRLVINKYGVIKKRFDNKICYLTFDDGPDAKTANILDALKKNNVKATFFVTKQTGYNHIYKRIVKEGHTIALHTATHDYSKIYSSEQAFFKDIEQVSKHVKKITGVRSRYIRFAGGSSNTISSRYCYGIMNKLVKKVPAKGYKYYDWNASSEDATGRDYSNSQLIANSVKGANGQNLCILMHDRVAGRDEGAVVDGVIKKLKAKGYVFSAIDNYAPGFRHKG